MSNIRTISETQYGKLTYSADNKEFVYFFYNIEPNNYITLVCTKQAGYAMDFKLDQNVQGKRETMISGKNNVNNPKFIIVENDQDTQPVKYTGDSLQLRIKAQQGNGSAAELYVSEGYVETKNTRTQNSFKGGTWVLCFEDASDDDFNDLVFTIGVRKTNK